MAIHRVGHIREVHHDEATKPPNEPAADVGGIECTVNRVGDVYHDQLIRSGHAHRLSDLDHFASLQFSPRCAIPCCGNVSLQRACTLPSGRGPKSVESTARTGDSSHRRRLVHHGSGPRTTCLTDESFVTGLSEYAGEVAKRFPWVQSYTPVNEPLTTARFSGLYGHWYPHQRCDEAFVTALVLQCLATAESMRQIRL